MRLLPPALVIGGGTALLPSQTLQRCRCRRCRRRFVLLSESDVPLYDPLTLYQQLQSERVSRVNLCRDAAPTDVRRWTWRMTVGRWWAVGPGGAWGRGGGQGGGG